MSVPSSELCHQEQSNRLFREKSFASAVLIVDMLKVSAERVLYVVWKGVPKSIQIVAPILYAYCEGKLWRTAGDS